MATLSPRRRSKPLPTPSWSHADWSAARELLATPYVPVRRWVLVSCPDDGPFPGLACEIAALSYDETVALFGPQTYVDLAAKIAPYVRAWNVKSPPPAEAGPTAFYHLDKGVLAWIRDALLEVHTVVMDPPPPTTKEL